MPDAAALTITFVLRPSPAAEKIGQQILSGNYQASAPNNEALSADNADMQAVMDFIQRRGLQLVRQNAASRTVKASGTVAQLESAFDVSLVSEEDDPMHPREELKLPADLAGHVIAVLGMDQRPIAKPRGAGTL
jgi:kumamolisin